MDQKVTRHPVSKTINRTDMTLIETIQSKMNADNRFHFLKGNNDGMWSTDPKGGIGTWIDLKKPCAGTFGAAVLMYIVEEKGYDVGVFLKIQMANANTLAEYETFFEGHVETKNDFERVMIMLGL